MKKFKKLDRKSLKMINGGGGFCNLDCPVDKVCGYECGMMSCVPRGNYLPPNC